MRVSNKSDRFPIANHLKSGEICVRGQLGQQQSSLNS